MVNFYIMQISMGKITIDDVPERYRQAVIAEIERQGVNINDADG